MGGGIWRALGDTDCETLRSGFLHQPVNAVSSLAYLLVGGALAWWGLHQPAGRRLLAVVYGAAVAANFLGGLAYHGPAWGGATWIHDVALLAPLVFVVLYDVSTLRPIPVRPLLGAFAVVLGFIGVALALAPRFAVVLNAVFAALLLGTELVAAGVRYSSRKARQAYAVAIAALVVGLAFNLLGRSNGPICSPGSPFQGHAVWHICTAVALGAWGIAALSPRGREGAPALAATRPA